MQDAGVDAERLQHPHAADAEDQLLPQPGHEVAAVSCAVSGRSPGGFPSRSE